MRCFPWLFHYEFGGGERERVEVNRQAGKTEERIG